MQRLYNKISMKKFNSSILLIFLLFLTSCIPIESATTEASAVEEATAIPETPQPAVTPFPTRPTYNPGELVDYTAQTGDTLPALAVRFNTTVEEIYAANDFIPRSATTMPPGMPMKIPIYYLPLWGSPFQIIPDEQFVNGPVMSDFDTEEFVASHFGWLNGTTFFVGGQNRSGAGTIDYVAQNFSVSPKLLLALLEYQTGAVSQPIPPNNVDSDLLGFDNFNSQGFYLQLVEAANKLNHGYYGWRMGIIAEFDRLDGKLERPDPWQNAASVALQYYFSDMVSSPEYELATSPQGVAAAFNKLFGDPWAARAPHIPGTLNQPEFRLPFEPGKTWTYTGGPHSGWGSGFPFAGLDFAPPSNTSGCFETEEWATAVTSGLIIRDGDGVLVLDVDGDGDEHTGWVVFHLHLASRDRVAVGTEVIGGQPIGHPSCEGGTSTGSHVHIARKYNGEWIPAEGVLAFNLEGWVAVNGDQPYQGTLVRNVSVVTACTCSNQASQIESLFFTE
jgi:murein DD-endopeptidase MepM/ murein hydrolase activator NlpD